MATAQDNADVDDKVGGSTVITTATYIMGWLSTGTAYQLRVNGAAEVPNVISGANNGDWFADTAGRDNVTIGAMERNTIVTYGNIDAGEVVVYDGAVLTAGQIGSVEAYLAARWGVTLA